MSAPCWIASFIEATVFSLIELQLKIEELLIRGTDLTDGPWCMSCPGPCGPHPVPSSHQTWVMIIIIMIIINVRIFLARTGAQEVTIFVRLFARPILVCLEFSMITFWAVSGLS